MNITDELREFASHCAGGMGGDSLRHIADRIDAEHDKAIKRWVGEVDALRDERDEYLESTKLWEAKCSAMAELPRDADGEPIRVGDTVEWLDEPRHPITVVGVGKNTLFYIDDDANVQWTMANTKRHHDKTIEDVLDELLQRFAEDGYNGCTADLVAEYAAKLQLKEES